LIGSIDEESYNCDKEWWELIYIYIYIYIYNWINKYDEKQCLYYNNEESKKWLNYVDDKDDNVYILGTKCMTIIILLWWRDDVYLWWWREW